MYTFLDNKPTTQEGLYPVFVNPHTGVFNNRRVSVGSMADSFYEYLLKLYLLTDHRDVDSLRMFNEAVRGIKKHLIGTAQSAYRGQS